MSWRLNPITICLWLAAALALWLVGKYVLQLLGPVSILVTGLGAGVLLLMRPPEFRRHSKREAGWRCLRCGYDLRTSGERCPECGAPVPEDLRRRRRIAAEMKAEREGGNRLATAPVPVAAPRGKASPAKGGGKPSC